ncbi:hypothetical protein KEJ51_08145 [Candidatus Bathyarchaeota archaeon]|nr:hypothetical protein [Candidatus Bathyarchaeota archaeon]MBS7628621.1 hypothetical protein [Candidatus Bathyarchaeota archaeon]
MVVFDPHGTVANRVGQHGLLKVVYTHGTADITNEVEEIYSEASTLMEVNELRLLKAKNLIRCLNELGKRGVGFILITQYSTSIPQRLGTSELYARCYERNRDSKVYVTLHPSSRLITRLPKVFSFIFSPYWYSDPFFIRHRKIG